MTTTKIFRTEYWQLRQNDLSSFVENVINRAKKSESFSDPASQAKIALISEHLQQYRQLLAATRGGGKGDTAVKDRAKRRLLDELNTFVNLVEEKAGDDPLFITAIGFSLWGSAPRPANDHTGAPINLRVSGTGRRGEIRLMFEDPKPSVVLTHIVEYSTDSGNTWVVATYNRRTNILLTGLPHCPDMFIRVRSIATRGRQSDWSEPVIVAVP